jgi:hypothetical protein
MRLDCILTVGFIRQDERSTASKTGQFSPQGYDKSLGKESTAISRYPTASPAKPTAYDAAPFPTPYSGRQGIDLGGGYDSSQMGSLIDNNLSLAFRGMATDDDYVGGRQQMGPSQPSGMAGQIHNPQLRPPPVMPHPRGPYNTYSQTDYSTYYPSPPPAREPYIDYQYTYDAYRGTADPVYGTGMSGISPATIYTGVSPQPLHPDTVADLHRQQFYHYGAAARPPGSQFYYPTHQGMMYPPSHSSMVTPQLATSNHATLVDKKREFQVCDEVLLPIFTDQGYIWLV